MHKDNSTIDNNTCRFQYRSYVNLTSKMLESHKKASKVSLNTYNTTDKTKQNTTYVRIDSAVKDGKCVDYRHLVCTHIHWYHKYWARNVVLGFLLFKTEKIQPLFIVLYVVFKVLSSRYIWTRVQHSFNVRFLHLVHTVYNLFTNRI